MKWDKIFSLRFLLILQNFQYKFFKKEKLFLKLKFYECDFDINFNNFFLDLKILNFVVDIKKVITLRNTFNNSEIFHSFLKLNYLF